MKKILIIMLSFGLATGVSAQHFAHGGGGFYGGPRVVVGVGGYFPYYSPFYYPFGYPYYGYGYGYMPSRLQMQIQDIKNDYSNRIWSVKHDSSLKGKERRRQVHLLKQERDKAINEAKLNYNRRY